MIGKIKKGIKKEKVGSLPYRDSRVPTMKHYMFKVATFEKENIRECMKF